MRPFDFAQFENLCDLRLVLETASVRKLCEPSEQADADLEARASVWLVTKEQRLSDELTVSGCDEDFHRTLVESAGNPEIARVHGDMMERIRIIRRLDFTQTHRIEKTYEEHAQILQAILDRRADQVTMLLRAHIEASKSEVRKITLHRLHTARQN